MSGPLVADAHAERAGGPNRPVTEVAVGVLLRVGLALSVAVGVAVGGRQTVSLWSTMLSM